MTNKNKLVLVSVIAVLTLAMVATTTLGNNAFANVKGDKDTGCTNGGGQDVGGKDTCPSSPPQDQESCNSTTGNDKCPKGQNK